MNVSDPAQIDKGQSDTYDDEYPYDYDYDDGDFLPDIQFLTIMQSISPFLIIIFSMAGITLNLLTCVSFTRNTQALSARLKLTLSLTVSDLALSLVFLVRLLDMMRYSSLNIDHYNKQILFDCLTCVSYLSGTFVIFLLAADLFYAVRMPVKYMSTLTKRCGDVLVGLIWGVSVALTVIMLSVKYSTEYFYVLWQLSIDELFIALVSSIGLIFIIVAYAMIFRRLQVRLRRRRSNRANKKAAVTLFLIIITYILFVLPRTYIAILQALYTRSDSFKGNFQLLSFIFNMIQVLILLNSVFDPVIYATRLPEVKQFYSYY